MSTENENFDVLIKQWKAEHGKLFKTTIDDQVYIWRLLKRKEYTKIMATKVPAGASDEEFEEKYYDRQHEIALATVLYPENFEQLAAEKAGLSVTISDQVLLKSGFGAHKTEEL